MIFRLCIVIAVTFSASPACADPILTPLVTAGLGLVSTSLASTTIVGSLTVGGLVTAVVEVGISLGASLLLAPKHKVKTDPSLPQQPTLQGVSPQSISPRYYAAGRVMGGGVRHWYESDGTKLIAGVVLNCEPVDGIDAYLIDGENIISWQYGPFPQLTSFYNGTVETIDCGANTQWPNNGLKWSYQYTNRLVGTYPNLRWEPYPIGFLPSMVFDFRNGLPAGNPSTLAEHYLPSLYTSAHKCSNLACVYAMAVGGSVILARMATYPRAWPEMTWVFRGATIYDPRDAGQSFDGSLIAPYASRADYLAWYFAQKSTWVWSRNSILVLVWYMTHYDGGRIHPSKINWASVVTEANYCDRPVAKFGGGTEPWARTDEQWHAGEAVRDVMARLAAACDATYWEDGEGLWNFWIAKPATPTVTITDIDISSIVIEEGSGALDEINYLTPSYMEPRENYQMIPAAPVRDAESIALVGERSDTVAFKNVASHNQAYRLAWRIMKRKNPPRSLTITGGPSLLRCIGELVVAVQSDAIPGIDGTYRFAKRSSVAEKLNQVTLYLALVSADDYDDVVPPYDPVSPYETSTVPPPLPVAVQTPDAPSLAEIDITGDKYIQATALVGGSTPGDASLIYNCEAREVDPSTHAPLGGWFGLDTVISQWVRESGVVLIGDAYEAHGWFVQNGVPSPMSGSSFITIV